MKSFTLLFGLVGLGLLMGPADAMLIQGTPRDFADRLFLSEYVFVATVDSAQLVKLASDAACGKGLGPFDATRLVLRVEESLHGDTLKSWEVLWSHSNHAKLEGRVGHRVIAWGNRSCPVNYALWGNVLTLSDSVFKLPNGLVFWEEDGPEERGSSLLSRFRERLARKRDTEHAFDAFDGLAIARVEWTTPGADFGTDMKCTWVAPIAGEKPEGSIFLRMRAVNCSPLGVGDSLLIPWNGSAPPREVTLSACAYRFRVRDGFAPELGVDLATMPSRIQRRDGHYSLLPLKKE